MYVLILVFSLFMWISAGGMLTFLLSRIPFFSSTAEGAFILVFIPHLVSALTLSFLLKFFTGRSALFFIRGEKRDVRAFLSAAFITFTIYFLFQLPEAGNLVCNKEDSWCDKAVFLLLSLLLFLPQTFHEELVFRVLPERIAFPEGGKKTRTKRLVLAFLSALFFLLPHLLNREVIASPVPVIPVLVYFSWGFLSSFLSSSTGSYRSAWAMHYMNNIFSTVFVSGRKTTLSGAPLFYEEKEGYSPLLIVLVYVLFLCVYIMERIAGRKREEDDCNSIPC